MRRSLSRADRARPLASRAAAVVGGVVGAVVLAAAPEAGVPVRGARQFRLRRRQSLSLPLVPG